MTKEDQELLAVAHAGAAAALESVEAQYLERERRTVGVSGAAADANGLIYVPPSVTRTDASFSTSPPTASVSTQGSHTRGNGAAASLVSVLHSTAELIARGMPAPLRVSPAVSAAAVSLQQPQMVDSSGSLFVAGALLGPSYALAEAIALRTTTDDAPSATASSGHASRTPSTFPARPPTLNQSCALLAAVNADVALASSTNVAISATHPDARGDGAVMGHDDSDGWQNWPEAMRTDESVWPQDNTVVRAPHVSSASDVQSMYGGDSAGTGVVAVEDDSDSDGDYVVEAIAAANDRRDDTRASSATGTAVVYQSDSDSEDDTGSAPAAPEGSTSRTDGSSSSVCTIV
jgi:hypothetical protein